MALPYNIPTQRVKHACRKDTKVWTKFNSSYLQTSTGPRHGKGQGGKLKQDRQ